MKIYVLVFQNGIDGTVMQAFYNKEIAENKADKLNGKGVRYGTYEVFETEIDDDKSKTVNIQNVGIFDNRKVIK